MATIKSSGLVLQRTPYSDTSLILKVYTAESGLVTLIAKGARNARSKFRSLADFFVVVEWVHPALVRGEILTLHDAALIEDLRHLRTHPLKQALGQVWLETYLRLSPGTGESLQRFDWLLQHLQSLNGSTEISDLTRLSIDFLHGFCHLSGYTPQFHACVHCGAEVTDSRLRMHTDMGGPVCSRCRREEGATLPLSSEAARFIEQCDRLGAWASLPSRKTAAAAEAFLWAFLQRHAGEGRRLKAVEVYQSLLESA